METKGKRLRSCNVTCKLLCIRCLTEIRVVVFITLEMPKALISSEIRAARPIGSKPQRSLGVRPSSRKKGRGVVSVSETQDSTKCRLGPIPI